MKNVTALGSKGPRQGPTFFEAHLTEHGPWRPAPSLPCQMHQFPPSAKCTNYMAKKIEQNYMAENKGMDNRAKFCYNLIDFVSMGSAWSACP